MFSLNSYTNEISLINMAPAKLAVKSA